MPYTRDQLVQSVAERLGLTGDGQSLIPSDALTIENSLNGLAADIVGRGVLDDVDLDVIEDVVFQHLAAMIANEVSDRFGVDDAMAARLAGRALVAERRLREITALPYSGATTPALFY